MLRSPHTRRILREPQVNRRPRSPPTSYPKSWSRRPNELRTHSPFLCPLSRCPDPTSPVITSTTSVSWRNPCPDSLNFMGPIRNSGQHSQCAALEPYPMDSSHNHPSV